MTLIEYIQPKLPMLHPGPEVIYLLHFPNALKNRRHYIGRCGITRIEERMKEHAAGTGSSITRALAKKNTKFYLMELWFNADAKMERKMKTAGHYDNRCVFCSKELTHMPIAEISYQNWALDAEAAESLAGRMAFKTRRFKRSESRK